MNYPTKWGLYWNTVEVDFTPVPGMTVWAVVVRYSTGSTFGHETGKGTVPAICDSEKKALAIQKMIEENKWNNYAPWVGYFETLESVHVEECVIRE